MGNVRYKSGDTARMLGITAETIRYYEKNGITLSQKDKENGYREFRFYEVAALQRIRLQQNFGFSLMQSFSLIDDCPLETVQGALLENQALLQKKLQWYQRLYDYSGELQQHLAEIPRMLNRFCIAESPALYHLKYQKERRVIKDPLLNDTIKRWYQQCPLVFTAAMAPFSCMQSWFQPEIGFSVYESDYHTFLHEDNTLVQYLPARRALYTIVAVNRSVENFYPPFIPLVDYVQQHRLVPADQAYCLPIQLNCCLQDGQTPRDYYQVWLPLE